jgi:hypothetical protein
MWFFETASIRIRWDVQHISTARQKWRAVLFCRRVWPTLSEASCCVMSVHDLRYSVCPPIFRAPTMNIYVGNLSFDATQNDIQDAFSQYGAVSSVNVIMDRETGRPRGFAFVEMPNDEEARAAIDGLNLQEIAGRAVNVNEAKPREDRSGGGRGRW